MRTTANLLILFTLTFLIFLPTDTTARYDASRSKDQKQPWGPRRVLVLTGENVHNVGELQMHVGNWGVFGSRPGSGNTFSEAPSAQWPAGSGVEYLYIAGLWVGAMKGGVPAVSTAAYEREFRPTQDPIDKIYQTAEGAQGGNRLPSLVADDDNDGSVDEDWLNGRDDDLDGSIDEDFAAVSKQMFSCWYTDDQPTALQIYPQHNPLNIMVRQESYQWEEDRFDDFVGANFWITNMGTDVLKDVFIGFFADGDAGPRDKENYWDDDATGFVNRPFVCTDLGPVSLDIAYTYDADGDEGETPGYFGIMFLGHTTDPAGILAPERVGISTYANFSGSQSFEDGGDPTNDFERYELLSSETIERDATIARDYRMLMAAGPFSELPPGTTLVFQTAFAIGAGMRGMIENGANAQLTYNGAWFNLDGDNLTGIAGRETPVYGPIEIVIDTCISGSTGTPVFWPDKENPIWVNNDCGKEQVFKTACNYSDRDSLKYMTGVNGQETQVYWIVGTAPPPPSIRIDAAAAEGVVIYWDNFSESVPDVKTQVFDFEGYRVWRADNWDRPLGTSIRNGPAHELWKLLFEADIVNNFREDTGLDQFRYEPLVPHIMSASRRDDMVRSIVELLQEYPSSAPPRPPGVTEAVYDTLVTLAQWELGLPEGRQYYRYVDRSIHRGRPYFYSVTAMDHAFAGEEGSAELAPGKAGDPSSNFVFVEPQTPSQPDWSYQEGEVYVVPNPATTESMQPWTLEPNNDDPTGIKVEFRNLPMDKGTIRIYTLAGDLVQELPFDGRTGVGTVEWDLVSRNYQDVTSGIYLFSVETETNKAFSRKIGKFVVIR
ncbi:MAG: hypothetical protein PVF33_07255 [Candidatus Latescibacterota bacterium]|jgi:hypothetical protein